MTASTEQETFSLVIDRQKSGASESDIRFAFQTFMLAAGLARADEMSTEAPPGSGNTGRMDLYVHNTCIEFKTNILKAGVPDPQYVGQLDGYIRNLLDAGTGVRNGILTDCVHYFLRRLGDEEVTPVAIRNARDLGPSPTGRKRPRVPAPHNLCPGRRRQPKPRSPKDR